MQVIYSDAQARHAPSAFLVAGRLVANEEIPERATRLLAAAKGAGHTILPPQTFGPGPVADIHSVDYLTFLAGAYDAWRALPNAGPEVMPNAQPGRHMQGRPDHVIGQAGYHMADTACPIGAGTWEAATAAADVALTATEIVLDGADAAYGLCRPPGHHAYQDMAGGFCFLNNAAIAAQFARRRGAERVAILDIDVHHGNGTQGIFYERSDVFFVSVHGDPNSIYPWFAGFTEERGRGAGHGYNLNLPLPRGADDDRFHQAIIDGLRAIDRFGPDLLVVSLGLDPQENDPLGIMAVTVEGFRRAGTLISAAGRPSALIQEGGYICEELGANLAAFLDGFENR